MKKSFGKKARWIIRFALFLLFMNLAGAVAFYFAVPAYQAMKHLDPGWMTGGLRATLSVLNVFAAVLVLKRYVYFGTAVLFVTGTVIFVHDVQMRGDLVRGFLFSYWDVMGLLAIKLTYRSAKGRNVQGTNQSEADQG